MTFQMQTLVPKGGSQIYCRVNDKMREQMNQIAKDYQCSEAEVMRQMIIYCLTHMEPGAKT